MLERRKSKIIWRDTLFSRTSQILFVAVCFTVFVSLMLYKYTEGLLTERLQDRMVAIVSTASTTFDSKDIEKIKNPDDVNTKEFSKIVSLLSKIRESNDRIRFAYIMRRTNDPNIFQFVADADALSPDAILDANSNGVVDDDELPPLPGDKYPVNDYPVLRDEAFYHPSVDKELQPDKWGLMMAAYAPIRDDQGSSIAIIGMDIIVDDFRARTQEALLPFLLFVLFLISLIAFQTVLLNRVSNEKINVVKELDRQKDELLGIVSHQLATPISALKWDFEMLLDGDFGEFNAEQKTFFGKLQEVAKHLADLASMILDVSRIQLGRMKVDRTDLDLQAFFGEILTVMEAKAQERKVNLVSSVPKNIGTASLDKRLMHMIVENLMSNAIKYTPGGGHVKLDVALAGKELKISVSDTGCGIPKQDQDKIFGKLFRASNVRSVDGNGFGLYVVKGATEAQGGTITFESKENIGTKFTAIIPKV